MAESLGRKERKKERWSENKEDRIGRREGRNGEKENIAENLKMKNEGMKERKSDIFSLLHLYMN